MEVQTTVGNEAAPHEGGIVGPGSAARAKTAMAVADGDLVHQRRPAVEASSETQSRSSQRTIGQT